MTNASLKNIFRSYIPTKKLWGKIWILNNTKTKKYYMFMFGEKWKILRIFFSKYFFRKIIKFWSFLGFWKFQWYFFLSFLVFHPKKIFSASEIYFCFLKKILDLIRSLHRSKIIKVGPPPQKRPFLGGGPKFICDLFQKFFNMSFKFKFVAF